MKFILSNGDVIKVRWHHKQLRRYESPTHRGITTCMLTLNSDDLPEQARATIATAKCLWSDQFNKSTGRKLSLARAMADILTKDQRREVWNQYLNKK